MKSAHLIIYYHNVVYMFKTFKMVGWVKILGLKILKTEINLSLKKKKKTKKNLEINPT